MKLVAETMSAWKYKQLMPKVIVAKLRLIDPKDLAELAGRSLDAVYSMLAKTSYQPDILGISSKQLDPSSFENALLKNLIRTYKEVADCSPRSVRSLLSTTQLKFEASNVKAILRAKEANLGVEEAMEYITPVGRLDETRCRKILEDSKSVSDVVDAFSDMEYGAILREYWNESEETKHVLMLEAALDKYVYGEIWKAVERLRGLDKKITRTVIGMEIDSINIKVILRGKAMGISENQIRHYLIPMSEVFDEKDWEEVMKAADVRTSIEYLLTSARLVIARDHQYMFNDLLKEYESSHSLSKLEMIMDRGLLKTSLKMLKRYTPFFNIGLLLAFLNLKWFEVRNLRAVVKGVENGISPDKIRKLLILPIDDTSR